jgi:hypothetical protein
MTIGDSTHRTPKLQSCSAPGRVWGRAKIVAVVALSMLMSTVFGPSQARAGCEHPASRISGQSEFQPSGYARTFKFLGRWVYEGGEAKYVPWEGSKPCQGPNCHADDLPGPDIAADTSRLVRSSTVAGECSVASFRVDGTSLDAVLSLQASTLAGFPAGFEYPP